MGKPDPHNMEKYVYQSNRKRILVYRNGGKSLTSSKMESHGQKNNANSSLNLAASQMVRMNLADLKIKEKSTSSLAIGVHKAKFGTGSQSQGKFAEPTPFSAPSEDLYAHIPSRVKQYTQP